MPIITAVCALYQIDFRAGKDRIYEHKKDHYMKSVSDKIAYYFVSFLMFAIIASFAFTGFDGFSGSSNEVASVDGTPVTRREYNNVYNMLMNQMSQGKSLTSKQIKDFGIRERALQRVIEQKHILNFATSLKLEASEEEIKNEIRELPYFKTGGKFDVNKYKQLLAANDFSPSKFESQIINDIKNRKMQELLGVGFESEKFLKQKISMQKSQATAWVVSYTKEDMTKNIKISKTELKDFIADEKNKSLIDNLYKTYEAEAQFKKEKVKPLKSMQKQLVTKHLQKTKRKELSEVQTVIKEELLAAMQSGKLSRVKKVRSKYGLNLNENQKISPLSLNIPNVEVKLDEILPYFKDKNLQDVLSKESQTHVSMVKFKSFTNEETKEEDFKKELDMNKQFGMFSIQSAIIKHAEKHAKVVTKVRFQ